MQKQGESSKSKSKQCPRTDCTNDAVIDPQFGVLPCLSCQKEDEGISAVHFFNATIGELDRKQHQRDVHGKDVIQPWETGGTKPNREFVKAYPDKAEEYFTKKELEAL